MPTFDLASTSRLTRNTEKIAALDPRAVRRQYRGIGQHIQRADARAPGLAGQLAPEKNGHRAAVFQPDPAAVKQKRWRAHIAPANGRGFAKIEQLRAFEEKFALFRKELRKLRQVHLLLIRFNLGKIRIVRHVQREIGR